MLFKFDCEHESFNIWGETHGIFKKPGEEGRNPELDRPAKAQKVTRALELIQSRLGNGKDLQDRYRVSISTATHAMGPPERQIWSYLSSSGLKRLKWLSKKPTGENPKLSLIQKKRWAISDKGKFEDLIKEIHDLVQKLYEILPIAEKERNALARRDIKGLAGDLDRLRLFEEASLGAYPTWSGAASVMREARSVHQGPGTISQWMAQVEDSGSEADVRGQQPAADGETKGNVEGISTILCLLSVLQRGIATYSSIR